MGAVVRFHMNYTVSAMGVEGPEASSLSSNGVGNGLGVSIDHYGEVWVRVVEPSGARDTDIKV